MADPKLADTFFVAVDLDAGTCQRRECGESGTPPFCDKRNNFKKFKPRQLMMPSFARVTMCTCKRTKHAGGVCDNSLSRLPR